LSYFYKNQNSNPPVIAPKGKRGKRSKCNRGPEVNNNTNSGLLSYRLDIRQKSSFLVTSARLVAEAIVILLKKSEKCTGQNKNKGKSAKVSISI
jgi:hypothetical protein